MRGARWHILLATLCMAAGVLVGLVLTLGSADWFYAFVDAELAGGRTPAATTEALRSVLYEQPALSEALSEFAAFLFSNNAKVGMLCFALGFAFGVPTVYLLFANGLMLGAFVALYADHGLTVELAAWLMIHGTTELFAIILCGAAGLIIGEGVVFPGPRSRLANLGRRGREAATLVAGAVLMLFVAALLEGLGRQLVNGPFERTAIGAGALALWTWYFVAAGRRGAP